MEKAPEKQSIDRRVVIEMLQRHDVTPTQQRVEIAQMLFARPQHLSADQLLAQVNSESNHVSKATVYNTLNLFARKGLVREVIVDPSRVFYDSNTSQHHHFFNVDTGELTDVPLPTLSMEQLPSLPQGTVAAGVDVIIRLRSAD
ncbi:MAG: transcriptional repressor [Gammaproteobacteria bacterium HGW-Gammaproteobacteria-1]|jgi:Fur family iron response transcriptional regulator|nr:MAG: transcriptional repressor [Gammaproteobacteria bacterium HGW-Gammaproteobacteria-1]